MKKKWSLRGSRSHVVLCEVAVGGGEVVWLFSLPAVSKKLLIVFKKKKKVNHMGGYHGFIFSLHIDTLIGAVQMVMPSIFYASLISLLYLALLNLSSNSCSRKYFIIYSLYLVFNHPLGTVWHFLPTDWVYDMCLKRFEKVFQFAVHFSLSYFLGGCFLW